MSDNGRHLPFKFGSAFGLAGAAAIGGAFWRRAAPGIAVRQAFAQWRDGSGSIYDLMDDDTLIIIPGTAPHCGTFRKADFLRDTAVPFVARFTEPPVPQLRALWSGVDGIVVRADATGLTRHGRRYSNDYIFVFEMAGGRVTRVTEFLDMTAFNAVWNQVGNEPAHG